jgi:phosphotransferase system enzyme I (PtsP)
VSLNYQSTLDDAEMIVDAYQGVFFKPATSFAQRYKEIQKEEEQIAKDLKQYETKAITPDGVSVRFMSTQADD